jgi:hypothetical protein
MNFGVVSRVTKHAVCFGTTVIWVVKIEIIFVIVSLSKHGRMIDEIQIYST